MFWMMKSNVIFLVAFLCWATCSFAQELPIEQYGDDVIYDAPAWLESFAERQDSVEVIYIYASWCGPCMAKIPSLRELKKQHEHLPIRWTMVSIDRERDDWLGILDKTQTTWRHVWIAPEEKKAFLALFPAYEGAVPTMLVVMSGDEKTRKKSYRYEKWTQRIGEL